MSWSHIPVAPNRRRRVYRILPPQSRSDAMPRGSPRTSRRSAPRRPRTGKRVALELLARGLDCRNGSTVPRVALHTPCSSASICAHMGIILWPYESFDKLISFENSSSGEPPHTASALNSLSFEAAPKGCDTAPPPMAQVRAADQK